MTLRNGLAKNMQGCDDITQCPCQKYARLAMTLRNGLAKNMQGCDDITQCPCQKYAGLR
jgi:hypothetical protein